MATTAYKQAYKQLAGAYDPQTKLINQQIAQLDPQQQAAQASLDQAKVNAFRDITNQSNARGVLFSGVPIDEQAQYTGTKYLPAVADLKSTYQNNKNTLLGQINSLNSERVKTAQGAVADQATAKADAAYKNAQLQLGYARLQSSNQNAAASRALRGSSASTSLSALKYAQQLATGKQQKSTVSKIISNLSQVTGGDGYISPQSYSAAKKDWVQAGYNLKDFDNYFGYFKNPANPYYGK